jgi:tripartite-type tricarboxylate transporter receptor subunit TctC
LLLLFGIATLHGARQAQPWPSDPGRVPYAPGGSSDTFGRIIAQGLTAALGQKVYVENLPGAGGLLGVAQIAHTEPDGYSLVITSFASLVVAPVMNPNIE